MVYSWVALSVAPVAVAFDSKLMAYVAVLAFYGVIGFSVCFFGLGVAIGFDGKSATSRVAVTSALFLVTSTAAREAHKVWEGGGGDELRCFESPIAVMGSLTLYLALLIRSSKYNYPHHRMNKQERSKILALQNGLMVAALVGGLLLGSLTGSLGMTNTAVTFGFLYAGEKYAEMHLERKWSGWLLVLGGSGESVRGALTGHCVFRTSKRSISNVMNTSSLALAGIAYKLALWLHEHPEFLATVLSI